MIKSKKIVSFSRSSPKIGPYKQMGFFQELLAAAESSTSSLSGSTLFRWITGAISRRRTIKDIRRMMREQGFLDIARSGASSEAQMREVAFQTALADYYNQRNRAQRRSGLETWGQAGLELAFGGSSNVPRGALPYFKPYDQAPPTSGPPKPSEYAMSEDEWRRWIERINRVMNA